MGKWIQILCCIIFIVSVSGFVQGAILSGGVIESDTLLTVTESPYLIEGDLTIASGAILSIEPGVEVRFKKINQDEGISNRAELIVEGSLKAVGTISHPILFTADIQEMGSWGGIYLQSSGSQLEYVQIEYATTGMTISSSGEVKNSWIQNNLETGIEVKVNATLLLVGNEITYNRVGLLLYGDGEITENRFHSNSYGLLGVGIASHNFQGNSFESNNYGIYLEGIEPGNQIINNLISGNDFGIYVDGGVPPRVNYNDLYNNSQYDFYHQAEADADARFNWWGTTDTSLIDAYIFDQNDISASYTYGYVDYSDYLGVSALAPTVLNLTAIPWAVSSGEMTVKVIFSKEMDTTKKPDISYGQFDPFSAYIVSPIQGKWLNWNEYQFAINIDENYLEGQYRFRIVDAVSQDGQKLKSNISYTFFVDRTPPTVSTGIDYFAFSPNGDGKLDSLEASLFFNEMAKLTYTIYKDQSVVYGSIMESNFQKEKVLIWDGKDNSGKLVTEGEYEFHLTLQDEAGNANETDYIIPVLLDTSPPILELNPIQGIQTSDLLIGGRIEDNIDLITDLAYRSKNATQWINLTQIEGNFINESFYTWKVTEILDGLYELKLQAKDVAGNENELVVDVDVDVNDPEVNLISPESDAHIAEEVIFEGEIDDYHLKKWSLEFYVEGVWNLLTSGVKKIDGEIYRLDVTGYPDGEYQFRLVAEDIVDRVTTIAQNLSVDNRTSPEVLAISVTHQKFSPNGDGIKDQVDFILSFSEVVEGNLSIYDNQGQLIRFLQGNGKLMEFHWDGDKEDGSIANDGLYNYSLNYIDQVGHSGVEKSGQIYLDTIPPLLTINPYAEATNQSILSLEGEVSDFYQLLVNESNIVVQNGSFSALLDLLEGENYFSVVAEDIAGNRSEEEITVVCDLVPPVIHLDSYKELTNQPQIEISGYIEEENLADGRVVLVNELGSQEMELFFEDQHFNIIIDLTVGVNELTIKVVDKASNEAQLTATVEYLPSIPEIYLIQPTNLYQPNDTVEVILKVLDGSEPLDPDSIRVELDGVSKSYDWDEINHEVKVELTGLEEGIHLLTSEAKNIKGEAGGGLKVNLEVDLTDPLLQINTPLSGEILDGWDDPAIIEGIVEDVNLESLSIFVSAQGDSRELLLTKDLRSNLRLDGDLVSWSVGEWPNGFYSLEFVAKDLSGRENRVIAREIEIKNTGLLEGQVLGNLEKIDESILYLTANDSEICEEISFNSIDGSFSQRVAVGDYDLMLAPWGYEPVVLNGIIVEVGQVYSGVELTFTGGLTFNLGKGKQLVGIPFFFQNTPNEINAHGNLIKGWDGVGYYTLRDWALLKPGRGYWSTGDESLILTLEGDVAKNDEYRLPLQEGWNLISSPFNYPYPLEAMVFQGNGEEFSFSEGVILGLIDSGVWEYHGWYRQAERLEPWCGYWLYAKDISEIIFRPEFAIFPFNSSQEIELLALDQIQSSEWEIGIRASLGEATDLENIFGTALSTTVGIDIGRDLREPPGYSPYISLYFIEPGGEKLTSSYQPPVQGLRGQRRWEMVVESQTTGWARLAWDVDSEAILLLELVDQVTGEKVNMLNTASYEYYHQGGENRKFLISAEKGNFEIKKVYNYPNPFSPVKPSTQGLQQGTKIRYLLTHDAAVELRIYDVMGRPVKRFPAFIAGESGGQEGWNELAWDGCNGVGQPVANGVYILKVTAQNGKNKQVITERMAVINRR